ncbi:MAG TPA: flagellar assembly protein FliW [Syntrophorhabdaceae bacterium]|nr:flagellar assembly protein FliW [Syntrophorhabdaceae bacterium]HRV22800.1 flagellar assembly protein FliW [Syntrophorhabdaceae bacterium]
MKAVSEIRLKGRIIGFEELGEYILDAPFGEDSPFRVLHCIDQPFSFLVVNPYYILEDYSFDIDDHVAEELIERSGTEATIAVLCIVRPNDKTLYVNLRSPIIVNTARSRFVQVVLQNEAYGVSVPFAVKKEE